jgi:hypothetical protein
MTNKTPTPDELGAAPCSPLAMEVIRGGKRYLRFWPHGGYEYPLELPVITSGTREGTGAWTWNGSLEKPTLRPSIKSTHGGSGLVSHYWLNDGECQHLADSTDGLAGQTLPLKPLGWQCDHGDEGMDHDWRERSDDAGEVDGIPGDRWAWRECRVCGARDDEENDLLND